MTASRPGSGVWATPWEDLVGIEVTPGVRVTALPFPTPLRYSFSYLVDVDDGVVVVDLGWESDAGWDRFRAGLERAGRTLGDVRGLAVTHVHPDHFGLAKRLRAETDAWIAVHPGERPAITVDQTEVQRRLIDMERWLSSCGGSLNEVTSLLDDAAELAANFPSTAPDVDLTDDLPVPDSQQSIVAIHTPGHTPGSTCFVHRGSGVAFTGDHVLPRITPNISRRPTSDQDPLADYLRSLWHLTDLDGLSTSAVLPGHEWGFTPLRPRVAEIDRHHRARLDEIEAAVARGADTVWNVAQTVTWSRPFQSLPPRARRSAIGETSSHLYRLHRAGRVQLHPGAVEHWTSIPTTEPVAPASPAPPVDEERTAS